MLSKRPHCFDYGPDPVKLQEKIDEIIAFDVEAKREFDIAVQTKINGMHVRRTENLWAAVTVLAVLVACLITGVF